MHPHLRSLECSGRSSSLGLPGDEGGSDFGTRVDDGRNPKAAAYTVSACRASPGAATRAGVPLYEGRDARGLPIDAHAGLVTVLPLRGCRDPRIDS
jgi:hypothetical protein